MNQKKKMFTGLVVVLVVIVLGIFFYAKTNEDDGFSVVYLSTGEIYIGRLKTVPDLVLTDSYLLQVVKDTADPTKNSFRLSPIEDALWSPKELRIMEEQVVFYGPILPESKIAEALVGK